jgi:hypothetical protein
MLAGEGEKIKGGRILYWQWWESLFGLCQLR